MAKKITEAVTEYFLMLSVVWTTTGTENLTLYYAILMQCILKSRPVNYKFSL